MAVRSRFLTDQILTAAREFPALVLKAGLAC